MSNEQLDSSPKTIVIATRNPGKLLEFQHALQTGDTIVTSLADYPDIPDIVEDGDTFVANARKKAKTMALALGIPVLADDSGLCVDALDGAPGVYSARYSGEGATDKSNNDKLLHELKAAAAHIEAKEIEAWPADRSLLSKAHFVCVLSLYDPIKDEFIEAEGTVSGYIMDKPLGEGGFGYDPLLWLPQLGCSIAELSKAEKQQISHRGEALRKLLAKLEGQM
ncbi:MULTISPECIES: RdgB/HAM1 family non-canonical purine NTP pyrophosphatase [unclassified Paenibacillus]|uniref:RdgB/HAM1 family non-canonical purine NTP pyrophosphatase n=1 Tax=unclassified Paenibacillus TaxID=185978 RepID=UPI002F404178